MAVAFSGCTADGFGNIKTLYTVPDFVIRMSQHLLLLGVKWQKDGNFGFEN